MLNIGLLAAAGFVAGALGGLLGIGGGVVLMPVLRFVVGLSPARAAGTCILAVFCTTLGGSYRHLRLGHLDFRFTSPVILSGVVTTTLFSIAFVPIASHGRWLDLGIGLVFALISLRMIVEGVPWFIPGQRKKNGVGRRNNSLKTRLCIGGAAGVLPGLLGIGTGVILVPAFTYILRMPIKAAVASSLTSFCANALVSSTFKFAQGFIDLKVALPICIGTLAGSNLGAVLNRHFPSNTVKLIFGLVFSYVSLKFLIGF
jgi:uncharacterized membrane protein YfcA